MQFFEKHSVTFIIAYELEKGSLVSHVELVVKLK